MLLETLVPVVMLYMIESLVLKILCYDSICCLSPDTAIGQPLDAIELQGHL